MNRFVPTCNKFDIENESRQPSLLSESTAVVIEFKIDLELILRSLNLFLVCLCRLCHLAILCLDQHAHTLHHLESLLTISLENLCLDNLDIFKEDLVYQSLRNNSNSFRDVAVLSAGGTTFGTSFELDSSLPWS
ncbi:hypothetical protein Tco_0736244 [Tanacetum coccineum]